MTAILPARPGTASRQHDLTVALVGNPNVGKSTIFNQLTGLGVMTAHYPGKSVELNWGTTRFDGFTIRLIDVPGIYALGSAGEEQWAARRALLDAPPEVVVAVVDATNLERNLYLVLQLLDLELPLVIALNLVDEAKRAGVVVDAARLADLLGVPVIPVQATAGHGVKELMAAAVARARESGTPRPAPPGYGRDVAEHLAELAAAIAECPTVHVPGLSPRAIAVLLMENDHEVVEALSQLPGADSILAKRQQLARHIEAEHGEPLELRLARERHGLAGALAAQVRRREPRGEPLAARLWRWSIAPATGLPLLLLVLALSFGVLFQLGNLLEEAVEDAWAAYASPAIASFLAYLAGDGLPAAVLRWGFDAGILAILSVAIPYVFVFYLILAFLEDSGYLNSVAFLLDNVMHRFGLHGRSAIPLVAAAGCNVPAIMSLRGLSSMRERLISSFLVVLVPCSARTAVIMGVVGHYAGWPMALALLGFVGFVAIASGLGLHQLLPGDSQGLVLEMFPFRVPSWPTVLRKTWYRLHDFVFVAFPIVLGGSLILGLLYETGLMWLAAAPLQPVIEGWLGLPTVAGLCLIFAVLRKELAMQLLVAVAVVQYGPQADNLLQFMSTDQLFVYALVNTIYMPCLATLAVLARDLGWRRVLGLAVATVLLALLAGGLATRILILL